MSIGTSASGPHFQAYLMDGLARWNQDREDAAVGKTDRRSYNTLTQTAANDLSRKVFGTDLCPGFRTPHKYTGE